MFFTEILIVILCLISFSTGDDGGPIVQTPSGKVRGSHKLSYGGKTFSAFEGIPYAIPPVGERRFEAPEPLEPWMGVWEATYLYSCAQVVAKNLYNVSEGIEISGDEDCLYLNIYVPREQPNPEEKLNVIVHIHGGGFTFGNGHFYAHPEYLMDRDAILVTFNYRLGILGFLSTEDAVIPGNNGLKDQVLALKWVQKNIACFGGNPGSVTITGASAGAASVHLHYLSPMSRGLFHRGLSNSGCAFNPWTMQKGAEEKSKILASAVGCPEAPSERLLKCLKQRSYRQILNKITLFYGYKFEPAVPFGPVVETGPRPFLNQDPYQLFVKREVQDLPWVSSNVAHEGRLLTLATFNNNIEEINADWEKSAPFALYYNYTVRRSLWPSFAENVKEIYLGKNQNVNDENFDEFVKIFTDRVFVYDGMETAKLHAGVTNASVYYYYFSYTGDNSTTVQHADDNQYFFSGNVEGRKPTENELKMKDVMLDMLMAYTKTGKPTIDGVVWEPTKPEDLTYLNISGFSRQDMQLKTLQKFTHIGFWRSVKFMELQNQILYRTVS